MTGQEYVRSLNSNYVRFKLDKQPEDNSYQYCILTRGGIGGLLSCSIRNIDGIFYTYYDISSHQSIKDLIGKNGISSGFICELFDSLKIEYAELCRFLLDKRNLILEPEHIFRDIETGEFAFLYIPYSDQKDSFSALTKFMVDQVDCTDEKAVETVYNIYERYIRIGDSYLRDAVFDDVNYLKHEKTYVTEDIKISDEEESENIFNPEEDKRALFQNLFSRRSREQREKHKERIKLEMMGITEESYRKYDAEDEDFFGKTVSLEDVASKRHQLRGEDGVEFEINIDEVTIGKKRENCKFVLENPSVSRMHARIVKDGNAEFIEDLNSTNGTYLNGNRMNPYDRKELITGDELRFGEVRMVYI